MADVVFPFEARFDDEGEIGRGGLAVVHRVFDRILGRHAALKIIRPACEAQALASFLDEARILAQLDHPNVVPVFDVFQDAAGDTIRILMKLVEGEPLAGVLAGMAGPPAAGADLERLLRIFLTTCDAVAFAHSRGIVHRDLTPANVMVGSYGQVYVMDWGLARLRQPPGAPAGTASPASAPRTLSGTLAYMAPEQVRGDRAGTGVAADVFALGAMLYEFLTFRPPWSGHTPLDVFMQARAGRVTPPEAVVADRPLPAALCRIAMRALAADPAERHPSVEALQAEVETFLREGGWFESASFRPGEVIVRDGDPSASAYIVTSGTCEVYRVVDGRRTVLRTIGPGGVFGEVGLFTGRPRIATVEAASDVTVLVVTRVALEREVASSSWMRAFLRAAIERFVELDRPGGPAVRPE